MASGWNLLYHEGATVLRECAAKGIAVHNAGTFATGLLAGGYTFVYGEAPAEMVAKRDQWSELCSSYSLPLPAVAMAFSALPASVAKAVRYPHVILTRFLISSSPHPDQNPHLTLTLS